MLLDELNVNSIDNEISQMAESIHEHNKYNDKKIDFFLFTLQLIT